MKKYKRGDEFYKGSIILYGKRIFNPSENEILEAGYTEIKETETEPTLEEVRRAKIYEIEEYDKSDSVNEFTLDGLPMWLDKNDRVGLANSLAIEEAEGKTETTLWTRGYNPVSFVIPIIKAKELLSKLELYALECYNVTQSHKKEVNILNNISDIKKYDVSLGYPTKLDIKINQ